MKTNETIYEVAADVGGRPGADCGGYCKYCYFRGVKENPTPGCRFCLPGKVGCSKCCGEMVERSTGFKDPRLVAMDISGKLVFADSVKIALNISGGGDAGRYPGLVQLMSHFPGTPAYLGYISGKGLTAEKARMLLEAGVHNVTFTVFSTDPLLRKEWMHDADADESLEALRVFASGCKTYVASVIVPGVNDKDIFNTARELEAMGAAGLILMRFGNFEENGIILGNAPIIPGLTPHSMDDFQNLVLDVAGKCKSMRVVGSPLSDPVTGAPFLLSRIEEFPQLPEVKFPATIITGSLAAPYIRKIFERMGAGSLVNVAALKKEIASLITSKDFEGISFDDLKPTVIFPGNALVHDAFMEKLINKGKIKAFRGPDALTVDCETSIRMMTREQVLEREIEGFSALIRLINAVGV